MRATPTWLLPGILPHMFTISGKWTRNAWTGWEATLQSSRAEGISCLVDTDVAIDFLRRRDYARKLLEKWAGDGLLAVSTLTHLEIYQGMKSGEEEGTNVFLDGLVSIAVDVPIARIAGSIIGERRSEGVTADIGDAIIAATALQLGAPLLTNNVEHYAFRNLRVVRGLEMYGTGPGRLKRSAQGCQRGSSPLIGSAPVLSLASLEATMSASLARASSEIQPGILDPGDCCRSHGSPFGNPAVSPPIG